MKIIITHFLYLVLFSQFTISFNGVADTLPYSNSIPHWQKASFSPDRIVATVTTDPTTSFSVTWRTDQSIWTTIAEITLATADARFDVKAQSVKAKTTSVDLSQGLDNNESYQYPSNNGLPKVNYHSVTFTNLTANTLYAYRVRGAQGAWSEWFQIKTAPANKASDLTFLYFGDAQNGMLSQWPRILRAAWNKAPQASFAIYAGDLVDEGARDLEWAQWLKAGSFMHAMVPAIVVSGNHEYDWRYYQGNKKSRVISPLWQHQFSLPITKTLPKQLQQTAYQVSYTDLDIFILDSDALHGTKDSIKLLQAQAKWLDNALQKSKATWRIVSMHHPVFSSCALPLGSTGQDEPDVRAAFLPILLKHNVELVLQGHDHTYSRGSIGTKKDQDIIAKLGSIKAVKSVFITSVGGPKNYPQKIQRWQQYEKYSVTLDRIAENTPTFQVLKKRGDSIVYQSFMANGVLYDEFQLSKNDKGITILKVAKELPQQRMFSNTGTYKDHHDLY